MSVGIKNVPRANGAGQAEIRRIHVPGSWHQVVRELRDRASTELWRYLEDPRLVLTLERDEYSALAERARSESEASYAERLASPGPVTVGFALLRGLAPKEFLRQERDTKWFTVFPDDSIEPAD
jgi:hypothetical protein